MGNIESYFTSLFESAPDMKITVPTASGSDAEVSIAPIIEIAKTAGAAIMEIYDKPTDDWALQTKTDDSPLTKADLSANSVICNFLKTTYPGIPIMTEEAKVDDYSCRINWKSYWCIDPLDGTKEFIKRNGEFTVNIALMETDASSSVARPVLGVVFAPALDRCYYAVKGAGAFSEKDGSVSTMTVREFSESDVGLVLVCSRSHLDERTQAFLDKFAEATTKSMGSSLKFMLVASGDAHIYPRLAPTMEWDTAASQIVVEEAGGQVINAETSKPLSYNKENLRNPYFYVYGKRTT